jgi:hypothetical protein
MSALYVIGNGFDLYHGLTSGYADFHRYVNETDSELADILENFFDLQHNDQYLWKDFENDLARFDNDGYFSSYNEIDVLSESFRPSDCFGLEDEITEESDRLVSRVREVFTDWVGAIEYPDEPVFRDRKLKLKPAAVFLNFNYTDTLEIGYGIPKSQILYIHNNANDFSGDLIFGHAQENDGVDDSTFDENGEPTRTMFTDAQNAARSPFYAFQKNTAEVLNDHRAFFETFKDVEEIMVLGHSLGEVDWPYFRAIAAIAPKAQWRISYHGDAAAKKSQAVNMLGKGLKIEMVQFDDLR